MNQEWAKMQTSAENVSSGLQGCGMLEGRGLYMISIPRENACVSFPGGGGGGG